MTAAASVAGPAPAPPASLPWVIAPVVALAAFMEVLDISIANVALRHIAGSLSVGQTESTWVLTSYLIANAIVLPVSGWISSVIGRKRFFTSCIAGFTASSLLCGLAPSLNALIAFRVLQGATGGGLQPSSQAILSDSFPPAKRGMAFAFYGLAVVFAPAIGPTLGGWITDNLTWRWVFLINVPVGAVLMLLTARLVEDPPEMEAARRRKVAAGVRIDYLGFGLLAIGLGFMQVVLDKGQQENWFDSRYITTLAVIAALALIVFTFRELRVHDPIVDLRLLGHRNFGIATLLMLMLGFVLLGSTVLIPLLVQSLMGYTAVDAGLVISPGGFAIMAMMPVIGVLVSRFDLRWLIVFGLMTCSLALIDMGHFNLGVDYWTIAGARVVQAIGLGFLFIPINTAAYVDVPRAASGSASAIINLARNLGGSIGIAVVATELERGTQRHQSVLSAHLTAADPQFRSTIDMLSERFHAHTADAAHALLQAQAMLHSMVERQATMLAYIDDFHLMAVLFLCLVPFVFLLRRPALHGGGPAGAH